MRFYFEWKLSYEALSLCKRDTSQLIFWVDRVCCLTPSSPTHPLLSSVSGATIFPWDLKPWKKRRRLCCQSNVLELSDWTASSSASCLVSPSVEAVWSDRSSIRDAGKFSCCELGWLQQSQQQPREEKVLHRVWLQSLCLLCIYKCLCITCPFSRCVWLHSLSGLTYFGATLGKGVMVQWVMISLLRHNYRKRKRLFGRWKGGKNSSSSVVYHTQ